MKKLNINYLGAFSSSIAHFENLESYSLREGFTREFQLAKSDHDTLTTAFEQLGMLRCITAILKGRIIWQYNQYLKC